jgi:LAGLIDADG DNA endonuclease family
MTIHLNHQNDLDTIVNDLNKPYLNRRVKLKTKDADNITLSVDHKRVIASTILGDASLRRPSGKFKNSNIQIKHSKKQAEWLKWKADQIELISGRKPFCKQTETSYRINPDTGQKIYVLDSNGKPKKYQKIRLSTRRLKCITEFHKEMTTNGELDFSKPWLFQYIDDRGLMIWWLDDGGLTGKENASGRLCTHGFKKQYLPYLQKLLKNKWNIETTIQKQTDVTTGGIYFFLGLSQQDVQKLLWIIMPYIPVAEMLYKTLPLYENVQAQKSWISTMYQRIQPGLHQDLTELLRSKLSSEIDDFEEFIQTITKNNE